MIYAASAAAQCWYYSMMSVCRFRCGDPLATAYLVVIKPPYIYSTFAAFLRSLYPMDQIYLGADAGSSVIFEACPGILSAEWGVPRRVSVN